MYSPDAFDSVNPNNVSAENIESSEFDNLLTTEQYSELCED